MTPITKDGLRERGFEEIFINPCETSFSTRKPNCTNWVTVDDTESRMRVALCQDGIESDGWQYVYVDGCTTLEQLDQLILMFLK